MTKSGATSSLFQELTDNCALIFGTPICIPSILDKSSAEGIAIRKEFAP
jgi:hypothetical protein